MDLLAPILLHHSVHEVEKFQPSPAFVVPARDIARADSERGEQGQYSLRL